MKRFFERLGNSFVKWRKGLTKVELILYGLGIIIGIVIGIIILVKLDTVPATANDYEPLMEQASAIEGNRDLLLRTDGNFNVKDEVITIIFENSECKLSVKYDQDIKILSTTKYDKSYSLSAIIIVAIISGFFGGAVGIVILGLIFCAIIYLWEEVICKAFKKD